MNDELNNSEESKGKLKLAKTNSLERELNSTLTKAIHEKYGSEADIDEIARQKKRDMRTRFFSICVFIVLVFIALLIWIKQGNFSGRDPQVYKDLATSIGNFTLKPNAADNLKNMSMALAKFSATSNGTDNDVLANGYAVFAIQEIKAGYVELGIADSRKTIASFPESPCAENLKKIVTGIICETCHGKGTILETCDLCDGTGRCIKCNGRKVITTLSGQDIKCNKCHGTGKCPRCLGRRKIETKCKPCKGTGNIFDERIFKRESGKIMTKAISSSAYSHTKAKVIDSLNKMQNRIN